MDRQYQCIQAVPVEKTGNRLHGNGDRIGYKGPPWVGMAGRTIVFIEDTSFFHKFRGDRDGLPGKLDIELFLPDCLKRWEFFIAQGAIFLHHVIKHTGRDDLGGFQAKTGYHDECKQGDCQVIGVLGDLF